MTVKHFPEARIANFIGVDWTNEPEKLALGALVDAFHYRVDEGDNLRTMEGLGAAASGAFARPLLDAVWYRTGDKIIALAMSGTTAEVLEIPRDLSSSTSKGTYTVTSGNTVGNAVDLFERTYLQVYKEVLKVWDGSTLASVQADLDGGGAADLDFAGIARFGGHLMGWGYGDNSGSAGEETNFLGADREEVLRWSHLGNPESWRAENWIMVGSRGIPVLACHDVFGRLAVLKTEGVWLLYGDLEQNFPQLEPLMTETDRALGVTGPHASTVYDGVLYWMSPRGPMRWRGAAAAEYIGQPAENVSAGGISSFDKSSASIVFPIPSMNAICFCSGDEDVPLFPGGGSPSPANGIVQGWLWDMKRDRWIGRWQHNQPAGLINAFVAPDPNGEYQAIYMEDLRTWQDDWANPFSGDGPRFRTSDVVLDEGSEVVVKGIVFTSDDWTEDLDNYFSVSLDHDAHGVSQREFSRLWIQAGAPTATATGQVWFDTSALLSKVWDGTNWDVIHGLPRNAILIPFNIKCRRAAAFISAITQTTDFKQIFQDISFVIEPL